MEAPSEWLSKETMTAFSSNWIEAIHSAVVAFDRMCRHGLQEEE